MKPEVDSEADSERRAFLKDCGRYAAITPPAVTMLLSTAMSSKAIAASSGRGGGKGHAKAGGGHGHANGHGKGKGGGNGKGRGRAK